jgi:hypothetical protein
MVRVHDFIKYKKDVGVVVNVTDECVSVVLRNSGGVTCVPRSKIVLINTKHSDENMDSEMALQLKEARKAAAYAEEEAEIKAQEAQAAVIHSEKAALQADSALEMAEKRAMTAVKLEESAKLAGNAAVYEKARKAALEASERANEAAEIAEAEGVAAETARQTAENAETLAIAASNDYYAANENYENAVADLPILKKVRVMFAGTQRRRKQRRTRRK